MKRKFLGLMAIVFVFAIAVAFNFDYSNINSAELKANLANVEAMANTEVLWGGGCMKADGWGNESFVYICDYDTHQCPKTWGHQGCLDTNYCYR